MAKKALIPDYALQPAKSVQTVEAKAGYEEMDFVCIGKKQQVSFRIEEDILVPDVKPDMEEILCVRAHCDMSPRERSLVCGEDLVNWTGNVYLQVIYRGCSGEIAALKTQLPYRHQWKAFQEREADAAFSCRVLQTEPEIVNERKLRLGITVSVCIARIFHERIRVLSSLEGVQTGSLELRRETVPLWCLGAVCKDEMEITEGFPRKDSIVPTALLCQDYALTENYRQITGDKIILNGFIHVNLVYAGFDQQGDRERAVVCQYSRKIEFTQFVPVPRSARGREYSSVWVELNAVGMNTEIVSPLRGEQGEELSAQKEFQCSGTIETKICLFERCEAELVTDAFHTDRELGVTPVTRSSLSMCSESIFELNTHDLVPASFPPLSFRGCEADLVACCCPEASGLTFEDGRICAEGSLLWNISYRDQEDCCQAFCEKTHFRGCWDAEGAGSPDISDFTVAVKSYEAEFLGDSQLELKALLTVSVPGYSSCQVTELTQPVYTEGLARKNYPLVITALGPYESLWDVAKRNRIPEASIRRSEEGRLLIIR